VILTENAGHRVCARVGKPSFIQVIRRSDSALELGQGAVKILSLEKYSFYSPRIHAWTVTEGTVPPVYTSSDAPTSASISRKLNRPARYGLQPNSGTFGFGTSL